MSEGDESQIFLRGEEKSIMDGEKVHGTRSTNLSRQNYKWRRFNETVIASTGATLNANVEKNANFKKARAWRNICVVANFLRFDEKVWDTFKLRISFHHLGPERSGRNYAKKIPAALASLTCERMCELKLFVCERENACVRARECVRVCERMRVYVREIIRVCVLQRKTQENRTQEYRRSMKHKGTPPTTSATDDEWARVGECVKAPAKKKKTIT